MLTVEGTMTDEINPKIQGQGQDKDIQFLLNKIDSVEFDPKRHDEIVIFSTRNHLHHRRLYPLIAARLCQKDIPCYFLFYNEQIARTFPDLTVDRIQVTNALREQQKHYLHRSGQIGYPRFNWEINLKDKIIKLDGIDDVNFFPVFRSTLQKDLKRYNINFENPEVAMKVQKGLFTADEVLRYCQLYLNFASKHDVEIRIVGWESNYLPHGLIHLFAQSRKNFNNKLQYINVGTQYAHYFGSREDFPYNVGSSNLTKESRSFKWSGYSDEFDDFFHRVRTTESLRQSVEEEMLSDLRNDILGTVDEGVKLSTEASTELKNRIQKARRSGSNVFCLFSHQFYDIPLSDQGPFSQSMCEWIDQTVDIFKNRDDILLLKPHPAEIKMPKDEWIPDETLKEYIGDKINGHKNIILLGPDALNSIATYELIDCGLVWRSSVGIEMMAFGIPMIVSGEPYWLEYLNSTRPNSLQNYKNLIDESDQIEVSSLDQTRSVVYLYFLKHFFHHFIPHIKNINYEELDPRKVRWDRDSIRNLINGVCPNIDLLIEKMNLKGYKPNFTLREKLSEPYENTLQDDVQL